MSHSCDACGETFPSKLRLELHRDTCGEDEMVCRECGERFDAARATTDGWHYACPNDDCDGEGLGESLVQLDEAKVLAAH